MAKKPPSTETTPEPIAEFLGPEVLIEYVPTESIKLWEGNPRLNDPAVPEVMKSIKEYGFLVPVVVGKDMVVKAGNTRLKAARKLGLKRIPIVRAEHLTEEQLIRFALVDNRVAEIATWDLKQISRLVPLEGLRELPGFDKDDYNRIQAFLIKESGATTEQDTVPEILKTDIQAGDIFILGDHRLMCGDSTSRKDVDLLMRGEKAEMVFTDPPYNVDYSNVDRPNPSKTDLGAIKNDKMSVGEFRTFISKILLNLDKATKEDSSIYLWYASASASAIFSAFDESPFKRTQEIIWKKPMLLGRSRYQWAHEPCIFGVKGSPYFTEERTKTTVWDIGGYDKSKNVHPTQKPVAICEEGIVNSSQGHQIVLDLFGGSGSTLIAADKTMRKCRMMEISPVYCQVIINRWETFSGKKATKG